MFCGSDGNCECKPGVISQKCNQCSRGYWNFGTHGCQDCGCHLEGSLNNSIQCDSKTGKCVCKPNIIGQKCDTCKEGYFSIEAKTKHGCLPCFCYGHSSQCKSSSGYVKSNDTHISFIII